MMHEPTLKGTGRPDNTMTSLSLSLPLQWGHYMFMHNGVVGSFMKLRRAMLASLSSEVRLKKRASSSKRAHSLWTRPWSGLESMSKSHDVLKQCWFSCKTVMQQIRSCLKGIWLRVQAFNAVQSFHSDSAIAFALFLHHLPDMHARLQPAQLLAAIEVKS